MADNTYITELNGMLVEGTSCLSKEFRLRQTDWLLAEQRPDGGFAGRRGSSDLYYTGFAARTALMLRVEQARLLDGLWKFLYRARHTLGDITDAVSLLLIKNQLDGFGRRACCPESEQRLIEPVFSTLEKFRNPEGGYSKTVGGPASVYHTFLAALCCELAGKALPGGKSDGNGIVKMFMRRRRDSGGFSDVASDGIEGTNATAAAVAVLSMFDALSAEIASDVTKFLAGMQRDDGGFAAARVAPTADLMSTFTATLTLIKMNATDAVKLGPLGRFVRTLAQPDGGFAGTIGDGAADVEYTCYGLGTLALLARHVKGAKCGRANRETVG